MTEFAVAAALEITPVGKKPETFSTLLDSGLFARVSVELTTGQASQAIVSVFDPDLKILNSFTTKEGIVRSTARVWIGYEHKLGEPVMKGVIARVERARHATTFRIYDMSYVMRQAQKTGYHRGADVAIMRKLVTRNKTPEGKPLKFDLPARFPPLTIASTIHDQRTDWEFLSMLAADAGLVLWTRDDTVFAREAAQIGVEVDTFEFGEDFLLLSDYDLMYRTPENVSGGPKVVVKRARGRGGRRLESKSGESVRGRVVHVDVKRDGFGNSKAALTRRAKAKWELEKENTFEARFGLIRPIPNRRIDVRDTIRVTGLGDLFSGLYLVDSVTYEGGPQGFSTSFDLYRK
jgi:hypothetical protein